MSNLRRNQQKLSGSGFTLLEMIIVIVLIGVLFAIAAPAWQAFISTQRLNTARSMTVTVLSEAKTRAKQQGILYEVGFRQTDQQAQWSTYPVGTDPLRQNWQNLPGGVRLLETPGATTFRKQRDIYRIQFNHRGEVNGQLGRITFISTFGGQTKRCVIVSTLLGAIREGESRSSQSSLSCD